MKEKVLQLIKEGKMLKEIVELTGLHDSTIRRYAKNNNLIIASTKTKVTDEIIKQIKELHKSGLTNKQIAVKLDMSPTTIRKYTTKVLNLVSNSERTKQIKNKDLILTNEQLEVLYGSLLGDMNIGINWKNARVSISHGGKQEEYFDHKCNIFKNILGKVNKTTRYDKRTNKYYNSYKVKLLSHPIFTEMYRELYPNGVKTISIEWLDRLTPKSIVFWFMDDGTNNGVLATNCFSYEECLLIQKWFKDKWNINTSLQHQKNKGGLQYLIYILAESKPIFYNLIKPYIIPSMEYKFKNWNP